MSWWWTNNIQRAVLFDEYGKMVTDPGIHYLEMNAAGQMFDGYYYFGGENGVLLQEEGETPEGFSVDKSGKSRRKIWEWMALRNGLQIFLEPMRYMERLCKGSDQ